MFFELLFGLLLFIAIILLVLFLLGSGIMNGPTLIVLILLVTAVLLLRPKST